MTTTANGKAALAFMDDETAAAIAARERRSTDKETKPLSEMVAEIEAVRQSGMAFDRDEHTDGISALT